MGFASLVFIRAFVDGSHYQMIENYIDLVSGHIQVHQAGFQQNRSLSKSIGDPASLVPVLQKDPDITAFSFGRNITALCFNDDFKSSICHALYIEGHRFVLIFGIVHHRVFHHFSIHLITMRA